MVDATLADDIAELEEDLNCILAELSSAFDPHTPFHIKNLDAELPGKLQILDQLFAEPTAESDTVAIPRGCGSESPDAVRLRQHEWLAYLVNEFGRLDGFELVCKVCSLSRCKRSGTNLKVADCCSLLTMWGQLLFEVLRQSAWKASGLQLLQACGVSMEDSSQRALLATGVGDPWQAHNPLPGQPARAVRQGI